MPGRKAFKLIGIVLMGLGVLGVLAIGWLAFEGQSLDRSSRKYVDAAVPAIVGGWRAGELLERASPEFRERLGDFDVHGVFQRMATLGGLRQYAGAKGEATIRIAPQGRVITAEYLAGALFEGGEAEIRIGLVREKGEWRIFGFQVNSPAFGEAEH